MATDKNLTFEDVNAHIEKHFSDTAHKQLTSLAAPAICDIYKIARPILVLASQAFFIPQKWKDIIRLLISALDAICPQH